MGMAGDVPVRESEIVSQLGQLDRVISDLEDKVNMLIQRLESVLSPLPPPGPTAPLQGLGPVKALGVPLAVKIGEARERLSNLRDAVVAVRSRVEC